MGTPPKKAAAPCPLKVKVFDVTPARTLNVVDEVVFAVMSQNSVEVVMIPATTDSRVATKAFAVLSWKRAAAKEEFALDSPFNPT